MRAFLKRVSSRWKVLLFTALILGRVFVLLCSNELKLSLRESIVQPMAAHYSENNNTDGTNYDNYNVSNHSQVNQEVQSQERVQPPPPPLVVHVTSQYNDKSQGSMQIEKHSSMPSPLERGLYSAPCRGATVCFAVVHNPAQGINDFNTQSSRCFDDIVYALVDSTYRLGGTACIRAIQDEQAGGSFDQCRGSAHTVIFGFNVLSIFKKKPRVPRKAILFNMEQVGKTRWFNSKSMNLLRGHAVWDYSLQNIKALKSQGINAVYVPVGYAKGLTNLGPHRLSPPKDIDVLLVGSCNYRRCAVLQQLSQRGMKTALAGHVMHNECIDCEHMVVPPVYGKARDVLISRARILLNVHFFSDVKVFEIARISYFLANSLFVVSEVSDEVEIEQSFAGGIAFVPFESLADECERYLHDDARMRAIASKGFDIVSKMDSAPHIRCPLFEKVGSVSSPASYLHKSQAQKLPHTLSSTSDEHLVAFLQSFQPPSCFRVVAVMAGFNEGDVVDSSIMDLLEQGLDVHYMDNWSTDETQLKLKLLKERFPSRLTYEVFPEVKPRAFNWEEILLRKEEYATQVKADWIVHVDPDELRESPWGKRVPLRTALYVVDKLSYNLVNFANLVVFHPVTTAEFRNGSLRDEFKYFEENRFWGNVIQVKAWKSYYSSCDDAQLLGAAMRVDLSTHGGHEVVYLPEGSMNFSGPKMFPLMFVLRHYPIRSQSHGMQKIFVERKARWNQTERKKHWHSQYNRVREGVSFVRRKKGLTSTRENSDLPERMYSSLLPCVPPAGR